MSKRTSLFDRFFYLSLVAAIVVIVLTASIGAAPFASAQGGSNVQEFKAARISNWLNIGTDLSVGGNSSVTGNETIAGTLGVTGNTTLGGTLAVTGNTTLTGNATVGGALSTTGANVTGTFARVTPSTVITVTAAGVITPTASFQKITAAGVITDATLSTTGFTAGDTLTIENTGSNSITILDSGAVKLAGNAALGQYDSLRAMFDGTNWIETGRSDN